MWGPGINGAIVTAGVTIALKGLGAEDILETGEDTIEADATTAAGRVIAGGMATAAMRDAANIVEVDIVAGDGPMKHRMEAVVTAAVITVAATVVTITAAVIDS